MFFVCFLLFLFVCLVAVVVVADSLSFAFLFKEKICQGRRHQRPGGPWSPTFLRSKKKKGRQKQIVLAILERLEFENLSYRPTLVTDNIFQCSMPPPPQPPHFEIHFAGPISTFCSFVFLILFFNYSFVSSCVNTEYQFADSSFSCIRISIMSNDNFFNPRFSSVYLKIVLVAE